MASERRAQVVQLAELLEIEFERGIGTAELMTLCIAEVEGRGTNWGQEPEEPEVASEKPPEGFRPALRSVVEPRAQPTRSRSRGRGSEAGARAEEKRKLRERGFTEDQLEYVRLEGDRIRVLGAGDVDESEEDAAEVEGGAEEVEPAVTYTRREKRRGGVRQAS